MFGLRRTGRQGLGALDERSLDVFDAERAWESDTVGSATSSISRVSASSKRERLTCHTDFGDHDLAG